MNMPIVYSDKYNVPIFNTIYVNNIKVRTNKPRLVYNILRKQKQKQKLSIVYVKNSIDIAKLYAVHDKQYIDKILNNKQHLLNLLSESKISAPFIPNIRYYTIDPMLWQVSGTLLATNIAYIKGWAINLGGGYSYASHNKNYNMCLFNDILIAAHTVFQNKNQKVLIIDSTTGESYAYKEFSKKYENVFILDIFTAKHKNLHNYISIMHKEYDLLRYKLDYIVKSFKPTFVLYVTGGSEIVTSPDDVNSINMVLDKDMTIFKFFYDLKINIACIFSMGGDTTDSYKIIATSINNICDYVN